MKEHGAIYLTPFSHRLAEEIDKPEYQRLRCRVNYHALRFKPHIMKLSQSIVDKLRTQGHFMSIHLRFEMDMLAFAGYADAFIKLSYTDINFKFSYGERLLWLIFFTCYKTKVCIENSKIKSINCPLQMHFLIRLYD